MGSRVALWKLDCNETKTVSKGVSSTLPRPVGFEIEHVLDVRSSRELTYYEGLVLAHMLEDVKASLMANESQCIRRRLCHRF